MKFDTPVLFLIFNRPETTKKTFAAIRKIRPPILYIAADGPRLKNEFDRLNCTKVRKITENIDWKCKVKRLYRKQNLGLKKSIPDAIDWFFKDNTQGIILEDDCLPNISFFSFCQEMLKMYKRNPKVMHISGDNFLEFKNWNPNDFYFTKIPHVWGWATWRRAWKKYNPDFKNLDANFQKESFKKYFSNIWEKWYWLILFNAVKKGRINTWDYQWVYTTWKNNGVSINPGVNLISNLGFGDLSVNTKSAKSRFSRMKSHKIHSRLPKNKLVINKLFDKHTSRIMFNSNPFSVIIRFVYYNLPRFS